MDTWLARYISVAVVYSWADARSSEDTVIEADRTIALDWLSVNRLVDVLRC